MNGLNIDSSADYDENGVYMGSSYAGTSYTYGYDSYGRLVTFNGVNNFIFW